ncbi:hypothetical protein MWU60_05005 [Yoonia sp. F2084L]|uniref:hypothetical protein n=1 Tax=Yoonia sp. F2084L TaxID=2926419 RepID=UPI001FF26860|nr:hypothetical protein [Yoonia sp. F2084L]MCK0094918.1 hypothetical protein [Yoonia sp. F2084L]
MIGRLTLVAFVGLSACAVPIAVPVPTPAPTPMVVPQSAKERFVSSVAANGCALTSANTDVIMADAVLSRQDMARVMTELRSEGRGEIDGATFRITGGACA